MQVVRWRPKSWVVLDPSGCVTGFIGYRFEVSSTNKFGGWLETVRDLPRIHPDEHRPARPGHRYRLLPR